ncbi:TPA: hypothetical protein I8235_003228 [Kluyvera intermedia]|nr:hypothetical protein [Kluyvera intermedia]
MVKPTEEEVITLLEYHGNCMTYQLANLIFANRFYQNPVTTSQVLRLMKKMEAAGKVKRVKSVYAVMICWALTTKEAV